MSDTRVVTRNGVYYLAKCKLDEEGEVENIIELIEFKGRSVKELRGLIESSIQSFTLPVIVMNAYSMRKLTDEE